MKEIHLIFNALLCLFFMNCVNNKTLGDEMFTNEKKLKAIEISTTVKDLVGKWKLHLEVPDANENGVPDPEEIKKGFPNNYQLQLNADGTCRIQQVHTGRYQKVTEKGNDMLKVYRKRVEAEEDTDPLPDIYRIVSVTKDELILQVIDGGMPSSFWIFKRIG